MVNSSQGGGSKDTWVLASRASAPDRELAAAEVVRSLPREPRHSPPTKWVLGPRQPAATAAATDAAAAATATAAATTTAEGDH